MARAQAFVVGALVLLAGCGREDAPAASTLASATAAARPSRLDPWRPCTLLSAQEAAALTGHPFFRIMSDNRMEGAVAQCAYGVGAGGLQGVVEVEIVHTLDGASPAALFAADCAPEEGGARMPDAAYGARCASNSGAISANVQGLLLRTRVLGRWGEVDPARSDALADIVGPRLMKGS